MGRNRVEDWKKKMEAIAFVLSSELKLTLRCENANYILSTSLRYANYF